LEFRFFPAAKTVYSDLLLPDYLVANFQISPPVITDYLAAQAIAPTDYRQLLSFNPPGAATKRGIFNHRSLSADCRFQQLAAVRVNFQINALQQGFPFTHI
jgi:hypothetical protein